MSLLGDLSLLGVEYYVGKQAMKDYFGVVIVGNTYLMHDRMDWK
jgi:hypothetical protein